MSPGPPAPAVAAPAPVTPRNRVDRSGAGSVRPVVDGIDMRRVPGHVAIVMDGTPVGRAPRLKRTDGHAAGEEALFDTARGRSSWGSRGSRVFAFSTENCGGPSTRCAS